jgi:short-subunit dehydrogenase
MTDRAKWAVITGASSGIGKALAYEFAAGGFNLFLTSRNADLLAEVAARCATKHGVQTQTFAADLSDTVALDRLIEALAAAPRHYEALVNNAGFGVHGEFAATDIQPNLQLVAVQITAALKLTRALLPGMIARQSGKILNVASVYSFSPVPFQSVYSACKAFLLSFSNALQNELQGTRVSVTVFCPGVTQTEFRSRAGIAEKRKDSGMTAQAAAHIAYTETLKGKHLVVPGFLNRVYVSVARLLPNGAVPGIIRFINRQRGHSQPL